MLTLIRYDGLQLNPRPAYFFQQEAKFRDVLHSSPAKAEATRPPIPPSPSPRFRLGPLLRRVPKWHIADPEAPPRARFGATTRSPANGYVTRMFVPAFPLTLHIMLHII